MSKANTIRSTGLSFRAVLLLLAFASSEGYQLPTNQRRAAFFAPRQRKLASACPKLFVGADFDSDCDFEAALGQAPLSEYERDAEFYRKRNEAYYASLRKDQEEEDVANFSFSDAAANNDAVVFPQDDHHPSNGGWVTDSVKASQNSFKYIEKTTYSLLTEKPMMALAIFAATGLVAAYLSGFFFLEGYIEDWNPIENDMVPYWDDAEIHTIERAIPPET